MVIRGYKMIFRRILFFLSIAILLQKISFADVSLGLGYPYLSLRSSFVETLKIELKYTYSPEINIYSVRGYWAFIDNNGVSIWGDTSDLKSLK